MGGSGRSDPQQGRLYAAEAALPPGRTFATGNEVRAFVEQVLLDEDVWDLFPEASAVRVTISGTLKRHGIATGSHITLSSKRGMDAATALHEVAHTLANDAHGPEFCSAFLWLVRRHMGFHAYGALRTSYDSYLLSYRDLEV